MTNFFRALYNYFLRYIYGKPAYKRLFVAIDVPRLSYVMKAAETIQTKVNDLVRGFGGNFRTERHLHVTLVFIGEIDDTKVDTVKKALKRAQNEFIGSYHTTMDNDQTISNISYTGHVELFGSALVLPLKHNDQIEALHSIIVEALKNYGITFKQSQEFIAHTTLGRIVPPKLVNNPVIKQQLDEEIINTLIDDPELQAIQRAVDTNVMVVEIAKNITNEEAFSTHSFKLYQSINGHYIELAHYTLQ